MSGTVIYPHFKVKSAKVISHFFLRIEGVDEKGVTPTFLKCTRLGTGGAMARNYIPMNELAETTYRWHKGMKLQQISRSLSIDRKAVRKYAGMARSDSRC